MKHLLLSLFCLAGAAHAQTDWQCMDNGGCSAGINIDGEYVIADFRKGDMVSTDEGWIVHPDDGWAPVRGPKRGWPHNPPRHQILIVGSYNAPFTFIPPITPWHVNLAQAQYLASLEQKRRRVCFPSTQN